VVGWEGCTGSVGGGHWHELVAAEADAVSLGAVSLGLQVWPENVVLAA